MSIPLMSLSPAQSLLIVFSQPYSMHFMLGPLVSFPACLHLLSAGTVGNSHKYLLDPTFPFPILTGSALLFRVQLLPQQCTLISTSSVQWTCYEFRFHLLRSLSRSLKTVLRQRARMKIRLLRVCFFSKDFSSLPSIVQYLTTCTSSSVMAPEAGWET